MIVVVAADRKKQERYREHFGHSSPRRLHLLQSRQFAPEAGHGLGFRLAPVPNLAI
jgi:hypothetical protein